MKTTATCLMFESSSSDKLYQTLLYTDGSSSCDCPGWTRRVQPDGSRFCKHTRLVAAGLAEREATKVIRYAEIKRPALMMLPASQPKPAPVVKAGRKRVQNPEETASRKFDFSL